MTFAAAFFVFCLDRLSKIIAVGNMLHGESVKVFPGIFHFTLVFNNGTAFGLMKGFNAVFAVVSALAIAAIIFYVLTRKKIRLAEALALGMILGGALGNLFDRMRFGYVIDFLDFLIWPVFNVADSAITIGIIILVIILCIRPSSSSV